MIRMPKRFSIVRTGDSEKVVAAHQFCLSATASTAVALEDDDTTERTGMAEDVGIKNKK